MGTTNFKVASVPHIPLKLGLRSTTIATCTVVCIKDRIGSDETLQIKFNFIGWNQRKQLKNNQIYHHELQPILSFEWYEVIMFSSFFHFVWEQLWHQTFGWQTFSLRILQQPLKLWLKNLMWWSFFPRILVHLMANSSHHYLNQHLFILLSALKTETGLTEFLLAKTHSLLSVCSRCVYLLSLWSRFLELFFLLKT